MPGLILAAPASNSGKTTITLALLRAFANRGIGVAAAKIGPDYIDPAFQRAACRGPCVNLDPWAVDTERLIGLAEQAEKDAELVLCEGVMGLFDGARDGTGSTADLARLTGWPVVLVVDVKGMAATAAAIIQGLITYRNDIRFAGVILNRVGSSAHDMMIRRALGETLPVFGAVPRSAALALPERHLGLVQAEEHPDLERFLDAAADLIGETVDLQALLAAAGPLSGSISGSAVADRPLLPPPGQRIAVANDAAFAFSYPHVLAQWRALGAEITLFSPLNDEEPDLSADAIYLPGGYPELHAGTLAAQDRFKGGMRRAVERGAAIYGECGGYMVLGEALVDQDGFAHVMTGLLSHATSFAHRKLTLGYRRAHALSDTGGLSIGSVVRGHEFHYATVTDTGRDAPLWRLQDALGTDLGTEGGRRGRVAGGFLHLIATEG